MCLGRYPVMLGFYCYLLGGLSSDIGFYRYLVGGLSCDVGFLSLSASGAILSYMVHIRRPLKGVKRRVRLTLPLCGLPHGPDLPGKPPPRPPRDRFAQSFSEW